MEEKTPKFRIRYRHDREAPILEGFVMDVTVRDEKKVDHFMTVADHWRLPAACTHDTIWSYCIGLCNTADGGWVQIYSLGGDLQNTHGTPDGD